MVFEHLLPTSLVEQKHWLGFILAAIYSTISIVIARLLFPANSGLVSVVFVSIFLIPYFKTLLKRDEQRERAEKGFSFKRLLADNSEMIKVYLFVFFGIYLTFMLYSFVAPTLGYDVGSIFREQLSLESLRGNAFSFASLTNILMNNWWVLLACFLVALVAGDGALFFIAWNASTWGTIFGYRAIAASSVDGSSAIFTLLLIILITGPHVLIEGLAYILAAIAGGVISDEVDNPDELRSFLLYFLGSVMLYIVVFLVAKMVFDLLASTSPLFWWLTDFGIGMFAIVTALVLLWLMRLVFTNEGDKMTFKYNYWLFVVAVCVFIAGAILETFVLYNSGTLERIYTAAAMFG
ncbi:hypothetical protein GOV11_03745 [Candidatus Woesearchaeota archaeon]|nr:hypothetical protein [Candidatus Woesearchaeota archaeon]